MRDDNVQGMLLTIIFFALVVFDIASELVSNGLGAMSAYKMFFSLVACLAMARLFWLFWKDWRQPTKS
jgi:low temperature requirement protein LtrA